MNDALFALIYKDARKSILNKINQLQAASLLMELLRRLHQVDPKDIQALQTQPPWRFLLLIKWTLDHGRFGAALPPATPNTINALLNKSGELETKVGFPSDHPDFHLYIRRVAYQQFWYQERPQRTHVSRQSKLFGPLSAHHPLAVRFRKLVGLSISDFITLSFSLAAAFVARESPFLRSDFFTLLEPFLGPNTIERFLNALSLTIPEARAFVRRTARPKGFEHYEYHERTPLTRYPLLRVESKYWIYTREVLLRGLETYIYDTLRADNASEFMNAFGAIFESYVRLGIEELNCDFYDEAELRKRYGKGKVVDFALPSAHGTVLIDAKGVEIDSQAMLTTSAEFLSRQVENSILKGLSQANELAQRMKLEEPPYVLIVTYKDLFLGSGIDFQRYADPQRVADALGSSQLIDMGRVFFLSAEEFDYLAAGLSTHGLHLTEFLAQIAESNVTPEGKRLLVMDHINNRLRPYGNPSYLETEFQRLMDLMKHYLTQPELPNSGLNLAGGPAVT